MLEAAEEGGVKHIVYTSSSNVASLKGISKADAKTFVGVLSQMLANLRDDD